MKMYRCNLNNVLVIQVVLYLSIKRLPVRWTANKNQEQIGYLKQHSTIFFHVGEQMIVPSRRVESGILHCTSTYLSPQRKGHHSTGYIRGTDQSDALTCCRLLVDTHQSDTLCIQNHMKLYHSKVCLLLTKCIILICDPLCTQ